VPWPGGPGDSDDTSRPGIGSWAARLPPAVTAIVTDVTVILIPVAAQSRSVAVIWPFKLLGNGSHGRLARPGVTVTHWQAAIAPRRSQVVESDPDKRTLIAL
jgi:hypothetical protein